MAFDATAQRNFFESRPIVQHTYILWISLTPFVMSMRYTMLDLFVFNRHSVVSIVSWNSMGVTQFSDPI